MNKKSFINEKIPKVPSTGYYIGLLYWVLYCSFKIEKTPDKFNQHVSDSNLLWRSKNATFPKEGLYLEEDFLISLNITMEDLEPAAKNCTKVYVWHTK